MTACDARSTPASLKWNYDRIWLSARWWLLAIAILHQVLAFCAFGFSTADLEHQVAAAQSLLDGFGLTCPSTNVADLSSPWRTQLLGWPPGYSVFVACVLYATGDLWIAVLAIHILEVALIYLAWFVILELLQPHVTGKAKLVLWIFWSLRGYPLGLLKLGEATAFAMFSCAIVSCLLVTAGRRALLHAGLAGVFLGGTCAFRYAYWPLVVVPPLAIIVNSFWSDHRRQQLLSGVVCGLVSSSLLGALIFSQQLRTGQIAFVAPHSQPSAELYWAHLLRFSPVPADMFGLAWIKDYLWRKTPAFQFVPFGVITWSFSALLLIATAFQWRWSNVKALGNRNCAILRMFLAAAVSTAILTIAMLCLLSVREPPQTGFLEGWTYVEEARYHVPYGVFLAIVFACAFAGGDRGKDSPVRNCLRKLAVILMIGAALFGFAGRAAHWYWYVIDHEGCRTEGLEWRTMHAAVRDHIESGRAVLILYSTEHPAEMSYASSMSLQCATQTRLASRGPLAVLVIARDADGAATLSAASKVIQERAAFRRVARVRHGWLYEATLPGL